MTAEPSAAELEVFRAALAREVGLHFHDDKLDVLAGALRSRRRVTGARTAQVYLERHLREREEIGELARTLTVSETYFLRDSGQFAAFAGLIRERAKTSARHLRMLSAGCSSGEEAYSLAMTVRDVLPDLDTWTVSILGVDINPEVLDKARTGAYGRWSLRQMPPRVQRAALSEVNGRYVVADVIRGMVRFEQHNLASPVSELWRTDAYDIVFCRNVLMYLTPEAARDVVARIARSLSPGGYLFLGHAENLRGLSTAFHLRQAHDTFFYEKRRQTVGACQELDDSPPPQGDAWFQAIDQASRRIEELASDGGCPTAEPSVSPVANTDDRLACSVALMKEEKFHDALEELARTPVNTHPDALLLKAVLLMSTGDVEGAEAQSHELLAVDDLNAGAHYVVAMCREHLGDETGAVEHARASAYLDPDFAMPHLLLGRLARRGGDKAQASRELSVALGLLEREDAVRVALFGGGFGREALLQLCRGELDHCGAHR